MNLKGRERLLVLAAILCFAALLGDRLILSPLVTLWEERSARILQLNSSLSEGRSLVKREEVLTSMWDNMKRNSLPGEVSAAENEVFQSVHHWVEKSHMNMTSLTPRWTQGDEDFKSLEFRATAQGNIASIARFLYELESDPLPLKVEEIEITARDDRGDNLSLGLRFSGLMLTDVERERS